VTFEAKSVNAKWHSGTCRQRSVRSGTPSSQAVAPDPSSAANPPSQTSAQQRRSQVGKAGEAVLRSTRAELRKLGAVDTLEGAQAVLLATRIADPSENGSSVGRLMAELRVLMGELRAAKPAADPVSEAQSAAFRVVRGGVA
jgi:hypothetical protein